MADLESMLAVRAGDLDRLGGLFEKYHQQLYNYFLRQVGDRQQSEDMVQEVFFRVLKYRHTFRGEGSFAAWIYSIAHRIKVDHFRKADRRPTITGEIDALASGAPNPQEQSERLRRHEMLHQALSRLSDEKREVLILSRFENLRYEDISQILGCPVGTVKGRVFRAIRDLRAMLTERKIEVGP